LTDELGSTLGLADSSGTLQTQYTYEPFGNTTSTGTASTSAFQYTGRENDGTGLYYYRARYYSPTLQRFISEDPLGFGGGDANLYAYTGNSPTDFTDPSGTCPLCIAAIGALGGYLGHGLANLYNGKSFSANASEGIAAGIALAAIPQVAAGAVGRFGAAARTAAGPGTALGTYRVTSEGETFYHYGYVENAANFEGGLRPGGFATSAGDLSGAEAQSGLALPAGRPMPNSVYTISPNTGTWIRVNPVAEPLFGQPGGLPEYQFPLGTGPGNGFTAKVNSITL
jgi:RHS repeat-associated protein